MLQHITFQTLFPKKHLKHSNKEDSPFFHLHTRLGPTLGTTLHFCVLCPTSCRMDEPHTTSGLWLLEQRENNGRRERRRNFSVDMWILCIKGMGVYSICWGSCSIYFRIQFSQSPILDFKEKWIGDLLKLLLAHLCQVDICRITIVKKKGLENMLYLFLLKYLVQHHGG